MNLKKLVLVVAYSVVALFVGANYNTQVLNVQDTVEDKVLDVVEAFLPERQPVLVYKDEHRDMKVFDSRCKDEDVKKTAKEFGIPREMIRKLKRADISFDGVEHRVCVINEPEGDFVIDITEPYFGEMDFEGFGFKAPDKVGK